MATRNNYKLLILFFVLSFIFIIPASILHAQTDNKTDTTPGEEWLTFRGNPEHTGKTVLVGPPEEIEMKWRWRPNEDLSSISASPAVKSDNTVYIATEGGRLGVINTESSPSWIYNVAGGVKSSPAVTSDGNVLVITEDGYVYYLDSKGELQWKSDFAIKIDSSPVINGETAYVGADDWSLIAINLNPDMSGVESESRVILKSEVLKWSFLTEDSVKTSPAFSGNTLFFGAGNYIYAINSNAGGADNASSSDNSTSALKWKYDVHADINSSPAVYNDSVYVGADDGYLYAFKENISTKSNNGTDKLGELIWRRKAGGSIKSSPAVDEIEKNVMIYAGSDDGKMYAFDEKGELKWSFSTNGPIKSSPAVDDNGDIYFGSDDGRIYALFPDGSLKWRSDSYGKIQSSPAIGPDEKLYVGSNNGYLYCIGESTDEGRESDLKIDISLSLSSIENNGNPTIVSAEITSKSEKDNVLSRIASVVIDLSFLNMIGFTKDDALNLVEIKQANMLDDGKFDDNFAGDGIFTFAFGITNDIGTVAYDKGVFTFFLSDDLFKVGPVPLMVTVTDLYGNRRSKSFPLNVVEKIKGSPPSSVIIDNRLSRQTLNISFSSGTPSILSIVPSQGRPGERLSVDIMGKNTNFTKNKTRVEIFNDDNFLIASAMPENYDVDVLSDISLSAKLNIVTSNEATSGGLTGRWDVTVTTVLTAGGEEVVVGKDLFEISEIFSEPGTGGTTPSLTPSKSYSELQNDLCEFTLDITNADGARPKGSPWKINSEYSRDITIERAKSGIWNYNVTLGECDHIPTYKIITTGSNFGYLAGEVRSGLTGEGIDNASITAITGDSLESEANRTVTSGGGYYLLPLSAAEGSYIVTAYKDGMADVEREVVIVAKKQTNLNFSLMPELNCPVIGLMNRTNLSPFYMLRDKALMADQDGRRWVKLYYKYAEEVQAVILNCPELAEESRNFLKRALKVIPELISTGRINYRLYRDFETLINMLIENSGPSLKKDLEAEKGKILMFLEKLENR